MWAYETCTWSPMDLIMNCTVSLVNRGAHFFRLTAQQWSGLKKSRPFQALLCWRTKKKKVFSAALFLRGGGRLFAYFVKHGIDYLPELFLTSVVWQHKSIRPSKHQTVLMVQCSPRGMPHFISVESNKALNRADDKMFLSCIAQSLRPRHGGTWRLFWKLRQRNVTRNLQVQIVVYYMIYYYYYLYFYCLLHD